jgi:hypothetical protein
MEKKMKTKLGDFFPTFKKSLWGQLVLSLGLLCCLSTTIYASYPSEFVGAYHNCSLKTYGNIACWGRNDDNQSNPPAGNDFTQVSAGYYRHNCALKSNGSIACWGNNHWGQSTPPAGNNFTKVSAGNTHTCALKNNDSIACWGDNLDGQSTPPVGNDFNQVSSGFFHNCAIKKDGSIACWGKDTHDQTKPPSGNNFIQISTCTWHTCALKTDSSIACWGDNRRGQSTAPSGNNFTQISVGWEHTCALKTDGSLACWGDNSKGQSKPPVGNDFTQVSAGHAHTCALKTDGSLACWGYNNYGQSTPPAGNNFAGGYLPESASPSNLSGTIYNKSGEFIAAATIEINGKTQKTDSQGKYEFSDIKPRNYNIKINKTDYNPITEPITIESNSDIVKNFVLDPSGEIQVLSITSKYSPNAHYLDGIDHNVTFTVNIDWGELTPKSVIFTTPEKTYEKATTETSLTENFNMGADFGVGGKLLVKAISEEGAESVEKEAKFVIMSKPKISGLPISLSLELLDTGDNFSYKADNVEFSTALFDEGFGASEVPENMPIFSKLGFNMEFIPAIKAEINSNGKLILDFDLENLEKHRPKLKLLGENIPLEPIFQLKSEFLDLNGQWKITEGKAGLSGTYNFEPLSRPFTIPAGPVPIPLFIKYKIHIVANAIANIQKLNPLELNGKIGINPAKFSGSIGTGVDETLSIEGKIQGNVDIDLQFPNEPTFKKFIVLLTASVKSYAFNSNWEKELGKCEWNYHTGDYDCDWSSSNQRANGSPSLISRDYLLNANANLFLRGTNYRMAFDKTTATELAPLQESVFPLSDPFIASDGTAIAALWIMDNKSRQTQDRTMAVYSQFKNNAWTTPLPIQDDGTADFHPELLIANDGTMLSAWENVKIALPDEKLETLKQNLEISVSSFDNGWNNTIALTNNDYFDRSPKLSGSPDNAIITWIGNKTNHITGNDKEPNSLNFSRFDGTTWTTASAIAQIPYPLIKYDVIFKNGKGLMVLTLDTDQDLETITDRELFTLSYENSTWGTLKRLTTDKLPDDNPELALDPKDNVVLVWLKDNALSSLSANGFSLPALSERQIILTDASGYSGNLADSVMMTSADGKLAILWAEASEKNDSDLYALFYDPIFKKWSKEARQLTDDKETERRIAATFNGNQKVIALYNRNIIGKATKTNDVPEPIGTDLYLLKHTLSTDLAIQADSFNISPANPEPGNLATLTIMAQNLSDQAIPNAIVKFYNGNPGSGGTVIASTSISPSLAPQETRELSVRWQIPTSNQPLNLFAVIDPDAKLDPINRGNNSQNLTTAQPDLSISNIHWKRLTNKHLSITARIKNEGSTPSSAVTVTFTDNLNGDKLLLSTKLDALLPYESKDLNLIWDISAITDSKHRIKVEVDTKKELQEFDETNNSELLNINDNATGLLSFSQASYNINENKGLATITVKRSSGSLGAASVDYATSDGRAKAGSDYTQTTGSLSWQDRDTSAKTFTVKILDDSLVEGEENFKLTLSNVKGAKLGTTNIASVIIKDNECTESIDPSSRTHTPAAGTGSVTLTTLAKCYWTAKSNVAWAKVTSGSSGTGNGTIKYSIEANNIADRSGTLSIAGKTFTINQVKEIDKPPAATKLVSPTGAITDHTPTYTWKAIFNSSWYYLWVNDSTGNKVHKWYKAEQAGCSDGTGTCSITPSTSLKNGKGTWWIQTWNKYGSGKWSSGMDFTLSGAEGPPAAKLVSPTGTITDHTLTYTWKAVSDSSWYRLWVNQDTAKKFTKWYKASEAKCSENCSVTPAKSLINGKYTWWIQTWNSNGHGAWSSGMDFTLTGAGGPPTAATLVSPKGNISDRTPTYTWNAVSNSTWYYLWVNKGTAKKFAKWYKAADANCDTKQCQVQSINLDNGSYTWWIQTWNSNGYGAWSSGMNFNLNAGTNNAENFISELAKPIKLGEEIEINLIISPDSAHVGKKADLMLVLEYWPTAKIEDRMSFYRDVEGNWQIWIGEALPPKTQTYKELPAMIKETISLGILEMKGEYRWYAAYVLTDGTVVSSSEPLVFVVE